MLRCICTSDRRLIRLQREERKEQVWRAALGALLQLSVVNGRPDRLALQAISPLVLSALLRCSALYHW